MSSWNCWLHTHGNVWFRCQVARNFLACLSLCRKGIAVRQVGTCGKWPQYVWLKKAWLVQLRQCELKKCSITIETAERGQGVHWPMCQTGHSQFCAMGDVNLANQGNDHTIYCVEHEWKRRVTGRPHSPTAWFEFHELIIIHKVTKDIPPLLVEMLSYVLF